MSTAVYPRRVLMTTDAVGGVWDFSVELARGLRQRGIEVVLASLGPEPDGAQREATTRIGLHLEARPFLLEWMNNPWDDVRASGQWLLELQKQYDCDLVHLNGYAHAQLPFVGPKLVVAHSCVLSWWRAIHERRLPDEWRTYQREVSAGVRAAHHVTAPTQWMLSSLAGDYGPLPACSVIHNGRSSEVFKPTSKKPFILAAGRVWDEAKNLRVLTRIGRSLPWPVKIAGSLSLLPDQRTPPGQLSTRGTNVHLVGRLPLADLAVLYSEAAIYALPARYEPFGFSVLEAALSRCALVLGDIPTLRELWDDAAVFVDPNDEAALRAALISLTRTPDAVQAWAARAYARAHDYGAAAMVDRYAELYARLLVGVASQPTPESSQCAS